MVDAHAEPSLMEDNTRSSLSRIWAYQRAFYATNGAAVWANAMLGPPCAESPSVARAHALSLLPWLEMMADTGPVFLIEIGAGSGRMAFRVLSELYRHAGGDFSRLGNFTYVMTEFQDHMRDHWQHHAWLRPFFEAGVLDTAVYDATLDRGLTLDRTGQVIGEETPVAGLALIAHDVFSHLPVDIFEAGSPDLKACLARLRLQKDAQTPVLGAPLDALALDFTAHETALPYYGDAAWDGYLADTAAQPETTRFSFPASAIGALRAFRRMSTGGSFLALIGDRGPLHDIEAARSGTEDIRISGAVSFPVNFNAIARDVVRGGGTILPVAPQADQTFLGILFDAAADRDWQTLTEDFAARYALPAPEEIAALRARVMGGTGPVDAQALFDLLELSDADPEILFEVSPALYDRLAGLTPTQRTRLAAFILQAWGQYFPVGEVRDIAFAFGTLLGTIGSNTEALPLLRISEQLDGPDQRTQFQISLCLADLGRAEEALAEIARVLEAGDFAPALALREALATDILPPT